MSDTMTDIDTLHAKLRAATKTLHRRLDRHPVLASLVRPDLDRRQYGDALLALHGVHAPLEESLATFFAQHPGEFDYRSRRKTSALEADLAELGRTPTPIALPADEIGCLSEAIGMLYPLEGSMLGGQTIVRQLRARAITSGDLPLRFFSCYGQQTHTYWRSFLAWAEAHCPVEQHNVAVAAAQRIFVAIADHLDNATQYFASESR